jgi:hypothetical protein
MFGTALAREHYLGSSQIIFGINRMTCYFGFENRTPPSSRTTFNFVAMAGSSV